MPKQILQIYCPSCHRRQALTKGMELPSLWFDTRISIRELPFIDYTVAYGGQGRGVKGKGIKDKVGLQTERTDNLEEAYREPMTRRYVQSLYSYSKNLVDYLESIGLRP